MSENFNASSPIQPRTIRGLYAGPSAKIMPDHTLPFWGNQDILTGLGPICLCFFRHA
jgi:hypothetical protein